MGVCSYVKTESAGWRKQKGECSCCECASRSLNMFLSIILSQNVRPLSPWLVLSVRSLLIFFFPFSFLSLLHYFFLRWPVRSLLFLFSFLSLLHYFFLRWPVRSLLFLFFSAHLFHHFNLLFFSTPLLSYFVTPIYSLFLFFIDAHAFLWNTSCFHAFRPPLHVQYRSSRFRSYSGHDHFTFEVSLSESNTAFSAFARILVNDHFTFEVSLSESNTTCSSFPLDERCLLVDGTNDPCTIFLR